MPSVNIAGKHINALNKLASTTLASVGLTAGSALLRLQYHPSSLSLQAALSEVAAATPTEPPVTATPTAHPPAPIVERPIEAPVSVPLPSPSSGIVPPTSSIRGVAPQFSTFKFPSPSDNSSMMTSPPEVTPAPSPPPPPQAPSNAAPPPPSSSVNFPLVRPGDPAFQAFKFPAQPSSSSTPSAPAPSRDVRVNPEFQNFRLPPAPTQPSPPEPVHAPVPVLRPPPAPVQLAPRQQVPSSSDVNGTAKPEKVPVEAEIDLSALPGKCERNTRFFRPSDSGFDPSKIELPDDFFDLTIEDLTRIRSSRPDTKAKEPILLTRAMREREEVRGKKKYVKVLIRVRFPDRHVLQGTFMARESVGALKDFVRDHLADPGRSFYLYVSPPVTKLTDETRSLIQSDLAPAALVYFSWDPLREGENISTPVLHQTCLTQAEELRAEEIPKAMDIDTPTAAPSPPPPAAHAPVFTFPAAQVPPGQKKDYERDDDGRSGEDIKKKPKWFSFAKKK